MKNFLNQQDFLLKSDLARNLYHNYAVKMPIFDYHCHLDPQEILVNKPYSNLTKLWLANDHYKWRLMRANGKSLAWILDPQVDDFAKFEAFCQALEKAYGNPIYHWCHLELINYLGINDLICQKNARSIWNQAKAKLANMTPRSFLEKSKVQLLSTTDDPISELDYHQQLKADQSLKIQILPGFRPDKIMKIEEGKDWLSYVEKLGNVSKNKILKLETLIAALEQRVAYFDQQGCIGADHSMEPPIFEIASQQEVATIFTKALKGETITKKEGDQFRTFLILALSKMYHQHQWVMQMHIGPLRNNAQRIKDHFGADMGYDSIGDYPLIGPAISKFLSAMDKENYLTKMILFNINPANNTMLAAMANNFNDAPEATKVQFGPAWWFNDHYEGNLAYLKVYASQGLLGNCIGMLTDSRSISSYVRHDYFRRILCNYLANLALSKTIPNDEETLGNYVQNISFNNADNFFKKPQWQVKGV